MGCSPKRRDWRHQCQESNGWVGVCGWDEMGDFSGFKEMPLLRE